MVDLNTNVACLGDAKRNLSCFFFALQGERGTGFGVALLLSLFGNDSNNTLLNSVAPPVKR